MRAIRNFIRFYFCVAEVWKLKLTSSCRQCFLGGPVAKRRNLSVALKWWLTIRFYNVVGDPTEILKRLPRIASKVLQIEPTCPLCWFLSFVGLNPSWDADSCSSNQEHPHIVQNPRFATVQTRYRHRHIFRCTLFHSTLLFYIFKIHFNIILKTVLRSYKRSFSFTFLTETMYAFLTMRAICVASLIVIYLIEWHALPSTNYTFSH